MKFNGKGEIVTAHDMIHYLRKTDKEENHALNVDDACVGNSGSTAVYIIPPRSRLLRLMGGIFLAWMVLLTITVTITAYVTIPLLVYLGYEFFLFARIWCSCKYSRFYLVAFPVASFLLSSSFKYIIYRYV